MIVHERASLLITCFVMKLQAQPKSTVAKRT